MFRNFGEIEHYLTSNELTRRLVLCGSHDDLSLGAVVRAKRKGFISVTLIGNAEKTKELLLQMGEAPEKYEIIDESKEMRAAQIAISMVNEGKADIPMKGLMQSSSYLMAIRNPRGGLMTPGAFLNEATAFYFPEQDRILVTGDCAITISPSLEDKKKITENMSALARALGTELVRVACVSVIEKPNPGIPSSMDAVALAQMEWGQNMVVEGPFALDNALDAEAARHKGIQSDVAGQADVLLMPDIHAGNVFHKSIHFLGKMPFASLACGAKCPIVFNSRTDDEDSKYNSILLAALQSLHMEMGKESAQ